MVEALSDFGVCSAIDVTLASGEEHRDAICVWRLLGGPEAHDDHDELEEIEDDRDRQVGEVDSAMTELVGENTAGDAERLWHA